MSSPLYISIAYYMQKEAEGVYIACTNAYVNNGRPHMLKGHLNREGAKK